MPEGLVGPGEWLAFVVPLGSCAGRIRGRGVDLHEEVDDVNLRAGQPWRAGFRREVYPHGRDVLIAAGPAEANGRLGEHQHVGAQAAAGVSGRGGGAQRAGRWLGPPVTRDGGSAESGEFVEDEGPGDSDVEAVAGADHGDLHDVVEQVKHVCWQAGLFVPEYDDGAAGGGG